MFPSPDDTKAHKRAASRIESTEMKIKTRASEINNPDELVAFILEVAVKKYRQGKRVFTFDIEVPLENLYEWAESTKLVSSDHDQLDRLIIRNEMTRIVKQKIKPVLASGTYPTIKSCAAGNQRLCFKVRISVLKYR